jgi:hypothetical protein
MIAIISFKEVHEPFPFFNNGPFVCLDTADWETDWFKEFWKKDVPTTTINNINMNNYLQ